MTEVKDPVREDLGRLNKDWKVNQTNGIPGPCVNSPTQWEIVGRPLRETTEDTT